MTQSILYNSYCIWKRHWIINSTELVKNTDSFENKASDRLHEWVIESFT